MSKCSCHSRIIRSITILPIIMSFFSCGGGGSGPSSTTTSATFMFFADGIFESGYSASAYFTGSDTAGGQYTAIMNAKTGDSTTFNGEQAIPIEGNIEIVNTDTKALIKLSTTEYYSDKPTNRRVLGSINNTNGLTMLATSANVLPKVVKIGDSGTVGSYVASNGSSFTEDWEISDAGNGLAKMETTSIYLDKSGLPTGVTASTVYIDQDHKTYLTLLSFYTVSRGITINLYRQYPTMYSNESLCKSICLVPYITN
jgi:hypothetical protein